MQATPVSGSRTVPPPSAFNAKPPIDWMVPRDEAGKTLKEGFLRLGIETAGALLKRGISQELLHGVTSWMAVIDPVRSECLEMLDTLHDDIVAPDARPENFDFDSASLLLEAIEQKWSGSVCARDGDRNAILWIREFMQTQQRNHRDPECGVAYLSLAIARMRRVISWPAEPVNARVVAGALMKMVGTLRSTGHQANVLTPFMISVCEQVGSLGPGWHGLVNFRIHFVLNACRYGSPADAVLELADVIKWRPVEFELERVESLALCLTAAAAGAGGSRDPEPVLQAVCELLARWKTEFPELEPLAQCVGEAHDAGSLCHFGLGLAIAARRLSHPVYAKPVRRAYAVIPVKTQIRKLKNAAPDSPDWQNAKMKFLKGLCHALAQISPADERQMRRHLALATPAILEAASVEELRSIGTRLTTELRRDWCTKADESDGRHV